MPTVRLENQTVRFHWIKRAATKKRKGDKYWSIGFVGPAGAVERSTGETAKRAAENSAPLVIAREFGTNVSSLNWSMAVQQLEQDCNAKNLSVETIGQYKMAIDRLCEFYPTSTGPADITVQMAKKFLAGRQVSKKSGKPLSQKTKQGTFDNLKIVYNRYLKVPNPFLKEDRPKVDKTKPRFIAEKEDKAWREWLAKRWKNWRLPFLFLEVKSLIGCRIGELTKTETKSLVDGRITFFAHTTKGRQERSVLLPVLLFKELKKLAGAKYVFENFAVELQGRHHGRAVKEYSPKRFKRWFQRQLADYRKSDPSVKYFKLHNYRGTAISKARTKGIDYANASLVFGLDEKTAKTYYENIDEQKLSDDAMLKLMDQKI